MVNGTIRAGERETGKHFSVIGTLPLMIMYAIGFMSGTYMPVWVGAIAGRYGAAVGRVGLIASYELGAVAFASILAAALLPTGRKRWPMAAGLIMSIAFNLVAAMAPTITLFTVARIIAGAANGFLLADVNGRAAACAMPSRVFAGQLFVMVVFAVIFFSAAPHLLALLGAGAPFFYCAGAGFLALLSLFGLNAGDREETAGATVPAFRMNLAAALLLAAATLLFVTMNGLWPYLGSAASRAGVSMATLSKVLAAGAVVNLLAPMLSEGLATRGISPALVMTAGILATAACAFLITEPNQPLPFIAGALLVPFFLIFLVPFFLTYLVRLDPSGKFVAASAAFFMIGSAIGPGIGSVAIDWLGPSGLAAVGVATPLLALAASWTALARSARS